MEKKDITQEYLVYLELIQTVVRRMGFSSLFMKGCAVATGLLAVMINLEVGNRVIYLFSITTILFFWLFDTYFLFLERKYRVLFNDVVKRKKSNDWIGLFQMNAKEIRLEESFFEVFSYTPNTLFYLYFLFHLNLVHYFGYML